MKELKSPFRLYDFLAYLFPGAATLHAIYMILKDKDKATGVLELLSTDSSPVNAILMIIAAYVLGLIWSVISREGLRRLMWLKWNPRIQYFTDSGDKRNPLGEMSKELQEQVQELFGEPALEPRQAHRLCRVYVAQYCPISWEKREAIVAVRSMCANFVGPALLYSMTFVLSGRWIPAVIAGLGAIAFLFKTVSLDNREWRWIYFAFLAHRSTIVSSDIKETENE